MSVANGWTERRRKQQACAIRRWKPWEKSTGPRTAEGRDAVKNNGLKHGFRSEKMRELCRLLRAQSRFVARIRAYLRENRREEKRGKKENPRDPGPDCGKKAE